MLDLTKITDTIGSLVSGNAQQAAGAAGLQDVLARAGIDPAMLERLSQPEILSLLQQYGIDPATIDLGQLGEMLEGSGVGVGGSIANAAADWLRSRGG
jgi:hypothetical protein